MAWEEYFDNPLTNWVVRVEFARKKGREVYLIGRPKYFLGMRVGWRYQAWHPGMGARFGVDSLAEEIAAMYGVSKGESWDWFLKWYALLPEGKEPPRYKLPKSKKASRK